VKIAYVLPHLQLYGGVRRALELCNRLLTRGHEVYFYTPSGQPCAWFDNHVPVKRLEEAGQEEFDLVVFSLESQWEEPKRFDTKAVLYYILHYGPLYKYPDVCRRSYQEPYYQIANSSWTAEHIERETGRRPPVVHGGINFDIFHPVDVPKIYDVLCYGDKRRPWKGRAEVELIEGARPEWVIGYMADIDPPQDEIASVYCSSRVFFSSSWFEGWNWMGLEAMACGIPLVVTKDGGSADYAEDNVNCLIVPPKSPELARRVIKYLLVNKALQKRYRTTGLETARRFTWEKSVETFEEQCEKAIDHFRDQDA